MTVKGDFPKQKMAILSRKKIFGKKPLKPFFRGPFPPHFHKKSEKSNEAISHKVQKTLFLGSFFAQICPKNFFIENRAPSHFGHHHFTPLYQKSKNSYDPVPRKVGNRRTDGRTNERTNEHRLIYRTSSR